MSTLEPIFIFTRDRPATLNKTLASIQGVSYDKYVIDDSISDENNSDVFKLCEQYSHCNYLGKEQFINFVSEKKVDFPKFNFLLREVGNAEWNLGYARNFALLYSKSIHANKVLFMDDDIQVSNLQLIDDLFHSIKHFQFVGANITGLADDSALGHIATDLGISNERMLSGGFMVFNPNNIDQYFLNIYNEDWIWLFLQLRNKQYFQTGEVFHEISNPLANYEKKIIFQEFGEIALDGILILSKMGSFNSLIELSFWKKVICKRREYLNLLRLKSQAKNNQTYRELLEWLKINSPNFTAELFSELFQKYFDNRKAFLQLYRNI